MNSYMVRCTACEKDMPFDRSSYGDMNEPFCFGCWNDMQDEVIDDMYGPGPHTHDFSRTGSFIGSTVLKAFPAPDASGWIDLEPIGGTWRDWMFKPDEEAPGCGVYTHKSNFQRTRSIEMAYSAHESEREG